MVLIQKCASRCLLPLVYNDLDLIKVTTGGDSAASPAEVGDSNAVSQEEEGEEEYVELVWAANESTRNEGATSALDGASLAGVPSCRMFSGTDFSNDRFIVRWTEVFFLASKDTE